MKRIIIALTLLSFGGLIGCGGSNPTTIDTPTPPKSPQALIANLDKLLADANNAADKAAIALRDQGKLSPQTTQTVKDIADQISILSDQIGDELQSGDSWTSQKQKIVSLLGQFGMSKITSDPTLQLAFSQVLSLIQQIQAAVAQ